MERRTNESEPGPPMRLGNAAAARVRLIVWCRGKPHPVPRSPGSPPQRARQGPQGSPRHGRRSLSPPAIAEVVSHAAALIVDPQAAPRPLLLNQIRPYRAYRTTHPRMRQSRLRLRGLCPELLSQRLLVGVAQNGCCRSTLVGPPGLDLPQPIGCQQRDGPPDQRPQPERQQQHKNQASHLGRSRGRFVRA
jgi:hypothetical protein